MFTPGGHRTCIGSNVELSIHFEKNLRTPAFRRSQKVSHFYWFYNTFFSHTAQLYHTEDDLKGIYGLRIECMATSAATK
jgi:hypothetical protein